MSKGTLIECKLHRPGGSKVDIGGTEYHFQPDAMGQHVCLIENVDHRDRFLSIPEAYRLPRVDTSVNVLTAALGAQSQPIAVAPAATVQTSVFVAPTPVPEATGTDTLAGSGADSIPGAGEGAGEQDGAGAGEGDSDESGEKQKTAPQAVDLATLDRDALAEIYFQRLGKKAHPAMKIPKMLDELKTAASATQTA